jgi:hypothetical protein
METGVEDVTEIDVVDVMETGVVDVMETGVEDVTEIDVVDVMEVDKDAMRVAIEMQKVDLAEKISVIEKVRQEINKKSRMGRGTDLVDGRETRAEIATARIKKAKDAMEGKVPASIARIAEMPNPTKTLPPLAIRPLSQLRKSRAALVSFWLASSEANRLGEINPERDAITWRFSGFAVVLT